MRKCFNKSISESLSLEDVELFLLCNQTYSLPTIITLSEVLKLGIFKKAHIVLHPAFNDPLFYEAIGKISITHGVTTRLTPIEEIPFKGLTQSAHFSTQIFAKLVLPLVSTSQFSFFLDSGYLVCNESNTTNYLQSQLTSFIESNCAIGLQGNATGEKLSVACPVLLFNKEQFKAQNLFERLCSHYPHFIAEAAKAGKAIMPEQALLSEVLKRNDAYLLRPPNAKYADLGPKYWSKLESEGIHKTSDMSKNYDVFKFTGSYKPWTLSVLNPDKKIFLQKAAEVSNQYQIDLVGYGAIHMYPIQNTYEESMYVRLSERLQILQYVAYNSALGNSAYEG